MREFKYAFTFFTNEQEVLYYTFYIENIIKNIFRLGLVWKRRQRGLRCSCSSWTTTPFLRTWIMSLSSLSPLTTAISTCFTITITVLSLSTSSSLLDQCLTSTVSRFIFSLYQQSQTLRHNSLFIVTGSFKTVRCLDRPPWSHWRWTCPTRRTRCWGKQRHQSSHLSSN